jgi:hypothetical protein
MDPHDRGWRLYGWYSGLMMCGSCFGVVTWAARMMFLVNLYPGFFLSATNSSEGFMLVAVGRGWRSVFTVTYAIEFLCLSAAKLMVLDRMSDFAAPQGEGMRKRWVAGGRIVMAAVVLANTSGLLANVAVAVHFQKSSEAFSAASACSAVNNTMCSLEHVASGQTELQLALSIASVQMFCEVVALLLILTAFVACGVLCARRMRHVRSKLLDIHLTNASKAADSVNFVRLQMLGTVSFVFVAFVLRSVVSTMLAVAWQFQDSDNICSGPAVFSQCDASCYNVYTHMMQWNLFTPQFLPMAVLVSSPLALLVALWGMTSKQTLQRMKARHLETVPLQ